MPVTLKIEETLVPPSSSDLLVALFPHSIVWYNIICLTNNMYVFELYSMMFVIYIHCEIINLFITSHSCMCVCMVSTLIQLLTTITMVFSSSPGLIHPS
jgi:hypothetical protein